MHIYKKFDVFGVGINGISLNTAIFQIVEMSKKKQAAQITPLAVHGLMIAVQNPNFLKILNNFTLVLPDGQPIRYCLNIFHNLNLKNRVYGPDLMLGLCKELALNEIPLYLYGSTETVVNHLVNNLHNQFPNLHISGFQASKFRELSDDELESLAQQISKTNAQVIFIGLGCPLQEKFAYRLGRYFPGVIVVVGAAFDFLSGNKPMAPRWMQSFSLEWLFRLILEPRRLWYRYLYFNTQFVLHFLNFLIFRKRKK